MLVNRQIEFVVPSRNHPASLLLLVSAIVDRIVFQSLLDGLLG
jgi:hypothetical protein